MLIATLAVLGCKKKEAPADEPAGSATPVAAAPGAPASADGWKRIPIPQLGLVVEAPAGAELTDAGDAEKPHPYLESESCEVDLWRADESDAADLAKAKDIIKSGHFFKQFTAEKVIDGGFQLAYQESGTDPGKPDDYATLLRITVGGKPYMCGNSALTPDATKLACTVKVCLSAKPS